MSVQDGHKTMARALRRARKDKQVELGHGDCLELVARTLGFASWNVLSAKGRDGPPAIEAETAALRARAAAG